MVGAEWIVICAMHVGSRVAAERRRTLCPLSFAVDRRTGQHDVIERWIRAMDE
jgi:hypothetical protein